MEMRRGGFICGLDIGSTKIAVALGKINTQGKIEHLELAISASRGVKRGIVTDLALLAESIREPIEKVQQKVKRKIRSVYINVNGSHIEGIHAPGLISVSERVDKPFIRRDLEKVWEQARIQAVNFDREIILEIPQSYSADGQEGLKDPLGLYGRKLGVDLYLVTGLASSIGNVVKSVNQAGLEVEDVVLSGLASGLAVSTEEERQGGLILMDIGGETTNIVVFKEGIVRYVEVLAWGGGLLTDTVAKALKVPVDLAEVLKKDYASVLSQSIREDENMTIKGARSYRALKRKTMAEALELRVRKLFLPIKRKLSNAGWLRKANCGLLFTGCTPLMEGILEMAEEVFGLPARLGFLKEVDIPALTHPSYAASVGLLRYGINKRRQYLCSYCSGKNLLQNMVNKLQGLLRDYF